MVKQRGLWQTTLHDLQERIVRESRLGIPDPFSEVDDRRFDISGDADIWAKVDWLTTQHDELRNGELEELQRVLGLTWNPAGLLWSLPLREHVLPASINTYDTMHPVDLVDGKVMFLGSLHPMENLTSFEIDEEFVQHERGGSSGSVESRFVF